MGTARSSVLTACARTCTHTYAHAHTDAYACRQLRQILAEADENEDNVIQYREFLPIMVDVLQSLKAKQQARALQEELSVLAAGMSQHEPACMNLHGPALACIHEPAQACMHEPARALQKQISVPATVHTLRLLQPQMTAVPGLLRAFLIYVIHTWASRRLPFQHEGTEITVWNLCGNDDAFLHA
eukprot:1141055-Pelagomonas_calceolata.AAC.7